MFKGQINKVNCVSKVWKLLKSNKWLMLIVEWKLHLYIMLEYLQIRNIVLGIFYLFIVDHLGGVLV